MNDTGVIDTFLGVFTSYIDSGFGLLGGEVAFLSTTLIAIDLTLAGLFWAWHGVAWCSEGFVLLSRVLAWGSGLLSCGVFHGPWMGCGACCGVGCAGGAAAGLSCGGGLVVLWRCLACWPLGVWREFRVWWAWRVSLSGVFSLGDASGWVMNLRV